MHIQAKSNTAASPADLEKFLRVISDPEADGHPERTPVNIEGVSGANLETTGSFVFSFDHDREADVQDWLAAAGYDVEYLVGDMTQLEEPAQVVGSDQGLVVRLLGGNVPGKLYDAIRDASPPNLANGRVVKDVVIGEETQEPHRFYVQISFQEIKRHHEDT